jgi:integrase
MTAKRSNQPGRSTPMPSVPLELGKYVTVRPPFNQAPRKDGTRRVFFQVPERLRPSDWPSLIPLPIEGARRGDLEDAAEVSRIQADAKALYERLQQARAGVVAQRERRDVPALVRSWQQTQRYKDKKPKTQSGYDYHAGLIDDWSEALGHPAISAVTPDAIEKFLTLYDDRPTTKRHILVVLKMLLEHAIDLGWIEKNPAGRITAKAPKTKTRIWERDDIVFWSQASVFAGQPALAALILTQWEIGQRLTDVRMFRRGKRGSGAEYQDAEGVFRFWQSKTESYVTIPVSDALRALLEVIKVEDSPYLFVDKDAGQPWTENRLSKEFGALRLQVQAVVADEAHRTIAGRRLVLAKLRHSCVVQLARAGCTVPEIAAITGHSLLSVERILSIYLPRDNEVAWNAQRKRGLVGEASHG